MAFQYGCLGEALSERLKGVSPDCTVFVGVGNRMRGDDAIGPVLIDLLSPHMPHVLDVSNVPENFTGMIKRLNPSKIVFIDAVQFGDCPAGYARIVEMSEAGGYGLTTHKFSLDMIMEYLKEETGADVFMIGVQPESIRDTEGLSPGMGDRLAALRSVIVDAFS